MRRCPNTFLSSVVLGSEGEEAKKANVQNNQDQKRPAVPKDTRELKEECWSENPDERPPIERRHGIEEEAYEMIKWSIAMMSNVRDYLTLISLILQKTSM